MSVELEAPYLGNVSECIPAAMREDGFLQPARPEWKDEIEPPMPKPELKRSTLSFPSGELEISYDYPGLRVLPRYRVNNGLWSSIYITGADAKGQAAYVALVALEALCNDLRRYVGIGTE
jgi:hypothetical protein